MRKFSKIASVILSGCMLFATFTSCKDGNNSSSDDSQVQPQGTAYTLFENGKFAYKAVVPENAKVNETFAATELNTFLYESCGKQLEIVTDAEVTEEDKCIFIGETKQTLEKEFTVDRQVVTASGYLLKTEKEDVYINGATTYGTIYGVYDFLNATVGFEVYTYDEIFLEEKDTITFYDFDVEYTPYVEWRLASGGRTFTDGLAATRMRMHWQKDAFFDSYGVTHTTFTILPPSTYLNTHPDWYNDPTKPNQLCYTAHGNPTEFESLSNETLEIFKKIVRDKKESGAELPKYISFTQQDDNAPCRCSACTELKDQYGTYAGVLLHFINPIAEELNAWISQEYPGERVNIVIFAYMFTEIPPVKLDENGEYVPIDESVRVSEYVSPWFAPFVTGNFGESFYTEANKVIFDRIKGWASICSDALFWGYIENIGNIMMFHDTFGSMFETYKMYEEFNFGLVFDQGNYNTQVLSTFSDFKMYLVSKLQWDMNNDYTTLRDNFFANYYGAASDRMIEIFEETRDWCAYMRTLGLKFQLGTDSYMQKKYWPQNTVESMIAMFDDAYKALEPLKRSNPERYQILYDRVLKEELFYKYILIELYSNTMPNSQSNALKEEWKAEVLRLGFTSGGESVKAVENFWKDW